MPMNFQPWASSVGSLSKITAGFGGLSRTSSTFSIRERGALYSREDVMEDTGAEPKLLAELAPKTVWDLGANTGRFSRIAASTGADVVSLVPDRDRRAGHRRDRAHDEQLVGAAHRGARRAAPTASGAA